MPYDGGARSRDSGRRADVVGVSWDASLVVPRLACLPEGAATHTASTRAASSRCCDASTPPTPPHESPRALRQFRDSVVPTQAKTTRRWRWLLIGDGRSRTRRRPRRPRSEAWGGVTYFRVAGSLHGSARSARRGDDSDRYDVPTGVFWRVVGFVREGRYPEIFGRGGRL